MIKKHAKSENFQHIPAKAGLVIIIIIIIIVVIVGVIIDSVDTNSKDHQVKYLLKVL